MPWNTAAAAEEGDEEVQEVQPPPKKAALAAAAAPAPAPVPAPAVPAAVIDAEADDRSVASMEDDDQLLAPLVQPAHEDFMSFVADQGWVLNGEAIEYQWHDADGKEHNITENDIALVDAYLMEGGRSLRDVIEDDPTRADFVLDLIRQAHEIAKTDPAELPSDSDMDEPVVLAPDSQVPEEEDPNETSERLNHNEPCNADSSANDSEF